jgi:hypothetical protein
MDVHRFVELHVSGPQELHEIAPMSLYWPAGQRMHDPVEFP